MFRRVVGGVVRRAVSAS